MKKSILLSVVICLGSATFQASGQTVVRPSSHVSTLVGSLSEHAFSSGNTYPAVALPWGMNFWTPQTGRMGDGWIYTYAAHRLRGFRQTHQPSPWINDYGQYALMPVTGRRAFDEDSRASWFSHQTEMAAPYYYSVYLADHDIRAEMVPTERAAVMRFTFPENGDAGVVVDAFDCGSALRVVDSCILVGHTTRNSGGVPDNFRNFFVVRFSKPFDRVEACVDPLQYRPGSGIGPVARQTVEGRHAVMKVYFHTEKGEEIVVETASSFISEEQAFRNLEETGTGNFDVLREKARDRWDEVLGRIRVEGGTDEQYRTFYSCLYRSTLFPRKFYEIGEDGLPYHYSPYNGDVLPGYMYTDTGFWDTFRALFPLLNLVFPSVNAEIQSGLANAWREGGFLPEWASPGHRNCMVGNNSASVVSDAILKGICPPEDVPVLYEAMMHARRAVHPEVASTGRTGHEWYNSLGYIPCDVGINESVARTLEYAYDDWCIAQVARSLGKEEDAVLLERAALNYARLFDRERGLMRGRKADGRWQDPFSPFKWGGVFTEGNAWHYTWSVFHDIAGLAGLMGGEKRMEMMLDSVFALPPVYDDSYYGYRIHEITEMQVAGMGNYAHGNQPAQHMIYLYSWCGVPWKTQFRVREVMDRLYSDRPDGYCGDEDNGQTSAWYVFSALGFYPVCPGSGEYVIGSPLFRRAVICLENGREITLEAEGNGRENRYVKSMRWNGVRYDRPFLPHTGLQKGPRITFEMVPEPVRSALGDGQPYSFSTE